MRQRISWSLTILVLALAIAAGCGGGGGGGSEADRSGVGSGRLTLRISEGGATPVARVQGEEILLAVSSETRLLKLELYRVPVTTGSTPDLARQFELAPGASVVVDAIPAPATYRVVGLLSNISGLATGRFQVQVDILPGQITSASATVTPVVSPSVSPTVTPGAVFDVAGAAVPASGLRLDMKSDGDFAVAWMHNGLPYLRSFNGPTAPTPLYDPLVARVPAAGSLVDLGMGVDDHGNVALGTAEAVGNTLIMLGIHDFLTGGTVTAAQQIRLTPSPVDALTVALPNTGLGSAAWEETSGLTKVLYNRFTVPTVTPVSAVAAVDPAAVDAQASKSLDQDEAGNFAIVYAEQFSAIWNLRMRVFNNDTSSVQAVGVDSGLTFAPVDVSVAIRNGRILVTWIGTVDGHPNVLMRRYQYDPGNLAAGVTALDAAPVLVNGTPTTGSHITVDVALDLAGNFAVVWEDYTQRDPDPDAYARNFRADGTGGPDFRVNPLGSGQHFDPKVAMDAAGNFVVIWRQGTTPVGRPFPAGWLRP